VSYNHKHNEPNRENNRDGHNDNRSWNCGAEGSTSDSAVERLRNRQVKNFLTTTLLSLGLPMLLMGDEVRRTQGGNNNAYCHDSESNWFDWSLVTKHGDLHRFAKLLIGRRLLRDTTPERQRMSLSQVIREGIRGWHGIRLNQPDWSDNSHSVALSAELRGEGLLAYFIFNAYWEHLDFQLPGMGMCTASTWRRWIDTFLEPPEDIVPWQDARPVQGHSYPAGPRSAVVLWLGY
jgi:glycogen operon protein